MLSKLMRMLGEINAMAAKRANVLALVHDLAEARSESEWLREYDADSDRYKGRDANRKLQRAIKCTKQRERMPALINALRSALADWEAAEGSAFLYDGCDQVRAHAGVHLAFPADGLRLPWEPAVLLDQRLRNGCGRRARGTCKATGCGMVRTQSVFLKGLTLPWTAG